ncbi:hypothetical protein BGZ83_002411 [Gryganskiella cystojenkinii]|nr:hypothetical protein BGZ83_002411 [Gryganskiella cystojenkinii]
MPATATSAKTGVTPTASVTAPAQGTATPGPTPNFNLPPYSDGGNSASGSPIFNIPVGTQTFPYANMPSGTGPNSPNYNQGAGSGSSNKSNLGMIIGITVAGVAVLAMAGLLIQRYRSHSRTSTLNSHQTRSRPKNNSGGGASNGNMSEEEAARGDKAKLAKSFTIRKPPSVYVEDDGDLDQTGHPRYKSDGDARNHPYYGDRTPGLVEYELSDTSGQKYGPSSVAERKRYVEQQQRKVMDEYEMFNPHRDKPPMSPYPASQHTIAPSYTSGTPLNSGPLHSGPLSPTMTPSMGGRSPRVHNPNLQNMMPTSPTSGTQSPFGRPMNHQQDDYRY